MKRLSILTICFVFAMCSCSKEQETTAALTSTSEGGIKEFTAVMSSTKVAFDNGKLAWENDDVIMVSDGNNKSRFKVKEINNGVATFTLVEGESELSGSASKYTAVYPASAFDGLERIEIGAPGEETSCLPMGAVSNNAKLVFTNLCALVKFSITTNTADEALKSITITADKPLSGAFEIVNGGAVMSGTSPSSASTSSTTKDGFALGSSPLVLYCAVPAGEYSRFDVEAVTTKGVKKVFPITAASVELQRSRIYTKDIVMNDLDINDFREEGPANCYIASHEGKYRFAATHNDGTSIKDISNVKLVWIYNNTAEGPGEGTIISSLSYNNGVIDFTTDGSKGSALIAAVDDMDNIVWSWHIWCTDLPSDITYPSGVMMDRYLGALSATPGDIKCVGMMYQNGRKDPFPGRVAAGNTLGKFVGTAYSEEAGPVDMATATSNPNIRYYGTDSNFWTTSDSRSDATWDGTAKTLQDPCPYGYRVPSYSIFGSTAKADIQKMFVWDTTNLGANYSNGTAWYPATGQLAPKGKNMNSGTLISFSWARNYNTSGNPYLLDLRSSAINGWGGGAAAAGFAVRCEKSSN